QPTPEVSIRRMIHASSPIDRRCALSTCILSQFGNSLGVAPGTGAIPGRPTLSTVQWLPKGSIWEPVSVDIGRMPPGLPSQVSTWAMSSCQTVPNILSLLAPRNRASGPGLVEEPLERAEPALVVCLFFRPAAHSVFPT